jgi:hypothetical protein
LALEKHLMIGRGLARFGKLLSIVAALGVGVVILPRAAHAQPAGPGAGTPSTGNKDLGDNIKSATNVGPFGNQIQAFVDERVKVLSGSDTLEQSKAREDLVRQVSPGAAGAAPTSAFMTDYARRLNTALLPLAQNKDIRVRLNAAIVAARVSQGAGNAMLLPATQALLKDASDAVALWATRAAQAILPSSIQGGADQLVPAIIAIGQTRPRVINGVYDALTIPTKDAKVLGAVVPAIHSVLDARIKQYVNGVPPDAFAEVRPFAYLVGQDEYQGQSVAQKLTTAQRLSDLLYVSAQRAGDLSNEQRRELAVMLQKVGSALSVIGQREGNAQVEQLGLQLRGLPVNASAKEMQDRVAPVYEALRAIPRFKALSKPPAVGQMTEALDPGTIPPPPATASTGPSAGR